MENQEKKIQSNVVKLNLFQICIVIIASTIAIISYYTISNILSSIVLILLGIEILIIYKKNYSYILNMPGIFGFIWFFTIGLSCLQLNHCQVDWNIETWIYLILTYIMFLIGFCIKIGKNGENAKPKNRISKKQYLTFLFAISAVIVVAFLTEVLIRKQIPAFSNDMSSYHNFGVTGIHYFTVLSCLVLPITIVGIYYFRKEINKKEWMLIITVNLIAISIPILIVSRHLILMTLVISAIVFLILNNKKEKLALIATMIIAIIGWFGISSLRNQNDEYLRQALDIQENALLSIKNMQVYMYIACNYDNFNANIDNINELYYGQKSFFPIFALTGLKFVIPKVAEDNLIKFIDTYNTYPIIMQPYQDLGGFGIILYMFIIGIFCRYIEQLEKNKPTNIIIDAIIKYCLIFSFFTNGFATPAIWFYVIIMIVSKFVFFKDGILEKKINNIKLDYGDEK